MDDTRLNPYTSTHRVPRTGVPRTVDYPFLSVNTIKVMKSLNPIQVLQHPYVSFPLTWGLTPRLIKNDVHSSTWSTRDSRKG